MKFNHDMEDMREWYDISDEYSLSLFLCYVVQDLKKYKLFVFVSDKFDVGSSQRSSNESVKDNGLKNFGAHDLYSLDEGRCGRK